MVIKQPGAASGARASLVKSGRFADKRPTANIHVPDIQDLADRLRFAPQQGRIWLDDQRMMLMHISSLGALRQELIESLGKETARGLITRIGYQAGSNDAAMSRKVRANLNTQDDASRRQPHRRPHRRSE